jgi:hypothetical protein
MSEINSGFVSNIYSNINTQSDIIDSPKSGKSPKRNKSPPKNDNAVNLMELNKKLKLFSPLSANSSDIMLPLQNKRECSLIIKDKQYDLDGDIEFSSFADLVIPFGLISGVGFISSVVFKNAISNIDNANWLESLSIYSNTYRFFSLFNKSKCIATDEKCVVHRQYNQRGDQLDVFFHEALMNTPKCLLKLLDMNIIKPDQLCRIVEECDPAERKYTLLPQRIYEIIYSFEEKLKTVGARDLCYLESLAQRMPSTFFSTLFCTLKNTISSGK